MEFVLFLVVGLLMPATAFAYVDPGTGSFIVQGIIATIVGAGVAIKLTWKRIKARMTGRGEDGDDDQDA